MSRLMLCLAVLFTWPLSKGALAAIILDDFQSAPFFEQMGHDERPPGGRTIQVIQSDLTGVEARSRRIAVRDISTGSEGTSTSVGVFIEDGGTLRFETDVLVESMGFQWRGLELDVTDPSTNVLRVEFESFSMGSTMPASFNVTLFTNLVPLRVGTIDYSLLEGGAIMYVPLSVSGLELPPGFDPTRVNRVSISTIHIRQGMSFSLSSVVIVPEPVMGQTLAIVLAFMVVSAWRFTSSPRSPRHLVTRLRPGNAWSWRLRLFDALQITNSQATPVQMMQRARGVPAR